MAVVDVDCHFDLRVGPEEHPFQGNATPTAIYDPILADVDQALHASFFGENMVACFERMGDPLPVAGRQRE